MDRRPVTFPSILRNHIRLLDYRWSLRRRRFSASTPIMIDAEFFLQFQEERGSNLDLIRRKQRNGILLSHPRLWGKVHIGYKGK